MIHACQSRRVFAALCCAVWGAWAIAEVPADYRGRPFADDVHRGGPQRIPGIIQCAWFDLGGEGVGYHDVDAINHGSGELHLTDRHQRPHASAYTWHFRADEGMDVSYIKDIADLNHPNAVIPSANQLYLGWLEAGEWCNYTVHVAAAGTYRVSALYSHLASAVSFSIDGGEAARAVLPRSTGGWHRWDFGEIGSLTFAEAGTHVLTFHFGTGNNFAFLVFQPVTTR
jgi:hypothetical protein